MYDGDDFLEERGSAPSSLRMLNQLASLVPQCINVPASLLDGGINRPLHAVMNFLDLVHQRRRKNPTNRAPRTSAVIISTATSTPVRHQLATVRPALPPHVAINLLHLPALQGISTMYEARVGLDVLNQLVARAGYERLGRRALAAHPRAISLPGLRLLHH